MSTTLTIPVSREQAWHLCNAGDDAALRELAGMIRLAMSDEPAKFRRLLRPYRLTPKQIEVAEEVWKDAQEQSIGPTMQELADKMGVSKVTIFEHIGALEKKGVLTRVKHSSRSLRLSAGLAIEMASA